MVNGVGTARRVRRGMTTLADCTVMTSVVCSQCGMHFHITHRAPACDEALASRQAAWLADQFVWDHIQENKHRASIDLPQLPSVAVKGNS